MSAAASFDALCEAILARLREDLPGLLADHRAAEELLTFARDPAALPPARVAELSQRLCDEPELQRDLAELLVDRAQFELGRERLPAQGRTTNAPRDPTPNEPARRRLV